MNRLTIVLLFRGLLLMINCSCSKTSVDSHRVYFTINHADKIVIPVQLNDSVIANMTFDTGGNFVLDSTFLFGTPNGSENGKLILKFKLIR